MLTQGQTILVPADPTMAHTLPVSSLGTASSVEIDNWSHAALDQPRWPARLICWLFGCQTMETQECWCCHTDLYDPQFIEKGHAVGFLEAAAKVWNRITFNSLRDPYSKIK